MLLLTLFILPFYNIKAPAKFATPARRHQDQYSTTRESVDSQKLVYTSFVSIHRLIPDSADTLSLASTYASLLPSPTKVSLRKTSKMFPSSNPNLSSAKLSIRRSPSFELSTYRPYLRGPYFKYASGTAKLNAHASFGRTGPEAGVVESTLEICSKHAQNIPKHRFSRDDSLNLRENLLE